MSDIVVRNPILKLISTDPGDRQKRQRFAQTLRGKVYNLIGLVFAFYCIARVLMVRARSG